jgi:hypothetical protein
MSGSIQDDDSKSEERKNAEQEQVLYKEWKKRNRILTQRAQKKTLDKKPQK